MELAAVVVVPTKEDLTAGIGAYSASTKTSHCAQTIHSSRMPILGNDVLRSWMEPIRKTGVRSLWLTARSDEKNDAPDLTHFAREGVERLLMIRLKSYAEMDLLDLLRFHRERRNSITDAKDARGHLGVSLLDRGALSADSLSTVNHGCDFIDRDATICGRTPYEFRGYAKRILSAKERQELVGDALIGACAMRPSGTQIREQVWIGEGATLADTVRIIGPTYVGARTVVRAGATLGPLTSLEHDCVVDCGTTVEESTVLPYTYLASGLMIRRALVDGGNLEDLGSGIVADLRPLGLGSRLPRRKLRGRFYGKPAKAANASPDECGLWSVASSASSSAYSSKSQPWIQVQL